MSCAPEASKPGQEAKRCAPSKQRWPGRGCALGPDSFQEEQEEHPGVWGRHRASWYTTRVEVGAWPGSAVEGAGCHSTLLPGVYRGH